MFAIKLNGAQILIEELVNHGVKTVFGYPGGSVLNIYNELYKNSDRIEHILTAHEQGAAHAADGYARVTGEVGVVIATSGPGATNLVTGIATAQLDSVPLVVITGNVATPLLGKDSFQEVDILGITLPIVKHSFSVRDVTELENVLNQAFQIAKSGRKGTVLIDITKDVQISVTDYIGGEKPKVKLPHKCNLDDTYLTALEMIKNSKKPFIYCGGGAVSSGASKEVLELSKMIDAPIGLSMMGLTAIPNDYELNLGPCGMHGNFSSTKTQSECDLLIALGVRFSDRATGDTKKYNSKCKVLHIDIDNAEINKNIPSNLGVCSDLKTALEKINSNLEKMPKPEWIYEVESFKKRDLPPSNNDLFNPENIIKAVNNHFDDNTIITTDVGQHQMWTMLYYKFKHPRTLLTSGGLGTMGYGMGASIGGCIANGKKPCVLFTGDGSFAMNLNEMATAVSQNLPLVIVLFNNGVLGMVRQWQTVFFDKHYSNTTLNRQTDFVKLANAFGADGYRVENLADLNEILENKLPKNKPCLIECMIDCDEKVLPMIPSGLSIDKIIMN